MPLEEEVRAVVEPRVGALEAVVEDEVGVLSGSVFCASVVPGGDGTISGTVGSVGLGTSFS